MSELEAMPDTAQEEAPPESGEASPRRRRRRSGPAISFLRNHKHRYLKEVGTDGGYFQEWLKKVQAEIEGDPDAALSVYAGLLSPAAQKIWREGTDQDDEEESDETPNLFSIAGVEIKPALRFRDESVPGHHRLVLSEVATVSQLFSQTEIVAEKSQQAAASAKRLLSAANTALRRAHGRAAELLVNVKD